MKSLLSLIRSPLFWGVILGFLFTRAALADEYLCASKKLKVKNGSIAVGSGIKQRTSACTRKEKQVSVSTSQSTVELVKGADGSGSGIDADSIDGLDSGALATTSALSALDARVGTAETSVADHETRIDTAESTITTHSSSIATTQSDLAVLDAQVSPGSNIVFVGTGAGYATLADAVTYVSGQTRSADSRWVIMVSPGVHTISSTVTVPSYTTIAGRGMFESVLRGTLGSNSVATASLLILSSGSAVRDIGVENLGVSQSSYGIYAANLAVSDETDTGSFDLVLDRVRVSVSASGGTSHAGIYCSGSNLLIKNSVVRVGNAGTTNYGLYAVGSVRVVVEDSTVMTRDTAVACASTSCTGISKQGGGTLDLMNSDVYGHSSSVTLAGTGTVGRLKGSYVRASSTCLTISGSSNLYVFQGVADCNTAVLDATSGTISCSSSNFINGTGLNATCS